MVMDVSVHYTDDISRFPVNEDIPGGGYQRLPPYVVYQIGYNIVVRIYFNFF